MRSEIRNFVSNRGFEQRRLDSCHVNLSTNENALFSNPACEDFEQTNSPKTKKYRKFENIFGSLVIKKQGYSNRRVLRLTRSAKFIEINLIFVTEVGRIVPM